MASEAGSIEDMPVSGQMIGTDTEIARINRRTRYPERWNREERRDRKEIGRRLREFLRDEELGMAYLIRKTQRRTISEVRGRLMSRLYGEGYPPSEIAALFKSSPSAVVHAHERHS